MTYQKEASVICLGDSKQAALYFERVVPISYMWETEWHSFLKRRKFSPPKEYLSVIANLIEPDHRAEPEIIKSMLSQFNVLVELTADTMCYRCQFGARNKTPELLAQFEEFKASLPPPEKMTEQKRKEIVKELDEKIVFKPPDKVNQLVYNEGVKALQNLDLLFLMGLNYMENVKFSNSDIYFRSIIDKFTPTNERRKSSVLLPEKCLTNFNASENDLSLSLGNIKIVDTENVQWDQILEFRKDKGSRKKLRNLRLFLHKNYEGKNPAFIEDDLNKRIEDYKNASKDWGFDLITSTISAAMDSKSIQASLSASLISTLFGKPILTTSAALPGIMEVGKITIELIRKKHAFHKLKRDHELAYIIEAKEQFKNT